MFGGSSRFMNVTYGTVHLIIEILIIKTYFLTAIILSSNGQPVWRGIQTYIQVLFVKF